MRNAFAVAEFFLTAKRAGMPPDDMVTYLEESKCLTENGHGRKIARMVSGMLKCAGYTGSVAQQLYERLGNEVVWSAAHEALMQPAYDALAVDQVKSASLVRTISNVADFGNRTAQGGVGAVSALLLASAMAGGGLGTLNWHMKQQQSEDDVENEEMKAKARFFSDTARQINSDARLKQPIMR